MILSDIILAVQRQFGDTSGAQISTADIIRWANEGQLEIVRKTECLQQHRETNVVLSDGSYELPSNFLMMKRVTLDNTLLKFRLLEDLDNTSSGVDTSSSATPSYYYTWGNTLFLYPTPSTSGTGNLDIWYICSPTTLINNADIPDIPAWLHYEIVRYCLARAKELDDDMDNARVIYADYQGRLNEAQYELHSQPLDSYPAVRVLPGDM